MYEKDRPDNRPKVYTLEEVSDLLRISHSTLYRAVRAGDIPAFKLRSQWRIPARYVDAMLEGEDVPLRFLTAGTPSFRAGRRTGARPR